MKAQFATMESLISLSLIISFIALGSMAINMSNTSFYANSKSLNTNIAAYDFVQQLHQNSSFGYCMSEKNSSERYSCAENYMNLYKAVYGESNLMFAAGNATLGYSNRSTSKTCSLYVNFSGSLLVCLIQGD